jgi:60 kDa SS-A/Ro ribonucleoprotein
MYSTLNRTLSYIPTQLEALPGMVPNNAGGFGYTIDIWAQLKRFLILGTTGGSYYLKERELTNRNIEAVYECIKRDPDKTLAITTEISVSGRAPNNDPAIFVLALLCAAKHRPSYAAIPEIARTFTHLSHFVGFIKKFQLRGWGRGFRRAVANWFISKSVDQVTYQAIKYKSRDGFSQKDVAHLSHVATFMQTNDDRQKIDILSWLGYIPGKNTENRGLVRPLPDKIIAVDCLPSQTDAEVVASVKKYRLPMEAIPTEQRSKEVYRAIAENANLGWLIRNLGNLGKEKLLSLDEFEFTNRVIQQLTDGDEIAKARLHPLAIFMAGFVYKQGKGIKGSSTWEPVPRVVGALSEAFLKSFKYVRPTNKRILYAFDVSASMSGHTVEPGIPLHCISGIMGLACANSEQNFHSIIFDTQAQRALIQPNDSLTIIAETLGRFRGGGTDCSQPYVFAQNNNLNIDAFVTFTDNETWAGKSHIMRALNDYREKSGINSRAINVAMVANSVTNFNEDPLCLELCGFDSALPQIISEFISE